MTSTRRGSGSGGRMWSAPCGRPHRAHWHHLVFSSCKEFGRFFTRILFSDRI